jgi:hypothetical protein
MPKLDAIRLVCLLDSRAYYYLFSLNFTFLFSLGNFSRKNPKRAPQGTLPVGQVPPA